MLAQLDAAHPLRSKVSDGGIGDVAHASRDSDHNPWVVLAGLGIVTARDFTHDPGNGLDCNVLADALIASNDPRIKYLIWNRRIWTPGIGWRPYSGLNPHNKHLHLSVKDSPELFDSTSPWSITRPALVQGEDVPLSADDKAEIRAIVDSSVANREIGRWGDGTPMYAWQAWYAGGVNRVDVNQLAAAIVGLLPAADGGGVTKADVVDAVRTVFADAARP